LQDTAQPKWSKVQSGALTSQRKLRDDNSAISNIPAAGSHILRMMSRSSLVPRSSLVQKLFDCNDGEFKLLILDRFVDSSPTMKRRVFFTSEYWRLNRSVICRFSLNAVSVHEYNNKTT
jgi:hypothetical protein